MANRHTLAVNKLEDFKQWLIDNDWKIEHTKGNYEVLRARKETEKLPIIVYKKDKEGLIHLSVSDWNLKYIKQFINSKNQKVETEQEAQFVAENYTTRVERFEPPFKQQAIYEFICKNGKCIIYNNLDGYAVRDYNNYYTYFDTYTDAVAYVRNLFNG